MSWRTIVISQRCKLDLKMGKLVVRADEIKQVLLDEISIIIVENTSVSITACLLNEIASRKIKLIFCDEKRNPKSELFSIYGSHDSPAKIKSQFAWKDEIKALVWTAIVAEKIKKQSVILSFVEHFDEAELLNNYVNQLELNDTTNREGHAAKVYFNALFGIGFKRGAEDSFNSALNYGYSIILSLINREVVANGYLTQLGLFHDNMFNQFNLSCDLMEPFRPLIDYIVLKKNYYIFESENKHDFVSSIMNTRVLINNSKHYLPYALQLYCKSIFEAINKNDVTYIDFYQFVFDEYAYEL